MLRSRSALSSVRARRRTVEMANLLFVCTGNAARSVMAVTMMRDMTSTMEIRGAGTFSISGLPMSQRTREALAKMNLSDPHHRSQQLESEDCHWADLILVFEAEHVQYIRRKHPEVSSITGTLPRIAKFLKASQADFGHRVSALQLDDVMIEPWEEVQDPAGGDQGIFDACAEEINGYISSLQENLNGQ